MCGFRFSVHLCLSVADQAADPGPDEAANPGTIAEAYERADPGPDEAADPETEPEAHPSADCAAHASTITSTDFVAIF